MNPQQINEPLAPKPLPQAPVPEPQPEPVVPSVKKSHRRLNILIAIISILVIGGIIGALLYYAKTKDTTLTAPQTTQAVKTNPDVQAVTQSLTSSSSSESTLTNTDDSADGTDASTSAGNVGDSVDENSF
ncbi:MAG: hypothetical protein JWO99_757 [Candidatus Saccharibacteria bacterium]|nr:hypothetical protein [Candidatus Saccharibacteria bacterium]